MQISVHMLVVKLSMYVGRSKANFKYTMKGNTLQQTSLRKDLGVMITDDGKTPSQCQYVKSNQIKFICSNISHQHR